jgi:hypothetical protein
MSQAIPATVRIVACAICLAVLASCETTRMSEAWVDKSYTGSPLESVLVIGLSDNLRRRALFEEELVSRFESRGVSATASFRVAPKKEDLEKESIRKKVEELGIKTIIVSRVVGVDTETYYVPGDPYALPYGYYRGFYGYYDRAYGYAYIRRRQREADLVGGLRSHRPAIGRKGRPIAERADHRGSGQARAGQTVGRPRRARRLRPRARPPLAAQIAYSGKPASRSASRSWSRSHASSRVRRST